MERLRNLALQTKNLKEGLIDSKYKFERNTPEKSIDSSAKTARGLQSFFRAQDRDQKVQIVKIFLVT